MAIKFIKSFSNDKRVNKKGLRIDVYREIQILNSLYDEEVNYDHTAGRITKLQQLLIGSMHENQYTLALVFEYYPFSLSHILRKHRHLGPNDSKYYFDDQYIAKMLYQICEGIAVLHDLWILHRDLKPSNILIDVQNGGIVKLCDFGLSKVFGQRYQTAGVHKQQRDGEIVTLFYRAPELFIAESDEFHESPAVDIWSIGCILAELIRLKPLFSIDVDPSKPRDVRSQNKDMLKKICQVLGVPKSRKGGSEQKDREDEYEYEDEENDLTKNNTWNGIELFGIAYFDSWGRKWRMDDVKGRLFTAWLRDASVLQKRLLRSVLMMDPSQRPNVRTVMNHQYFKATLPKENDPQRLLLYPTGNYGHLE